MTWGRPRHRKEGLGLEGKGFRERTTEGLGEKEREDGGLMVRIGCVTVDGVEGLPSSVLGGASRL